jgi:hypothetical protein
MYWIDNCVISPQKNLQQAPMHLSTNQLLAELSIMCRSHHLSQSVQASVPLSRLLKLLLARVLQLPSKQLQQHLGMCTRMYATLHLSLGNTCRASTMCPQHPHNPCTPSSGQQSVFLPQQQAVL